MSAIDGGTWPASHLTIAVLQARRLRPKNRQGGSNPYVQVQLGNHSFTTQLVRNTLCPVWNATVTFTLPDPQDDAEAVTLTVMHRRSLAVLPDKFLGRAEVRLVDVCQDHLPEYRKWLTLESKPKKRAKDRGEMEVRLCLGNLHSYTRVHSQLSSICPARDGGWGSTELLGSSSVQTVEKCEPIQPSCAAGPGLDQAPPSVAAHTHEPAASPECVSSSGDGEFPKRIVQALSDHSCLNKTTAAITDHTTPAANTTDGKAGDGTPGEGMEDGNHASKCHSSTVGTQTPPPHCPLTSGSTGQPNKLLLRLSYAIRHLQYRWGLRASSGETQPLHTADVLPKTSHGAEGVSESTGRAVPWHSHLVPYRLRALCRWLDRCLGER